MVLLFDTLVDCISGTHVVHVCTCVCMMYVSYVQYAYVYSTGMYVCLMYVCLMYVCMYVYIG